MSDIISTELEYIGNINDDGYVFNTFGECIAHIEESGYIVKQQGFGTYGKIDEDGTIRDSSNSVIGNIQKDGYVYINSKRVCHVDSDYIRKITPKAWNYGHFVDTSCSVKSRSVDDSKYYTRRRWPFSFGTTLKILIGIVLGVICIIQVGDSLGFLGSLIAIPFMILVVFIVCFVIRIINGW